MKNNSPQKQAAISWIILMIGILLAVIGAMTAKEYRVNLCPVSYTHLDVYKRQVIRSPVITKTGWLKCQWCGASPPPDDSPLLGLSLIHI